MPKILIIEARFYENIAENLFSAAEDVLKAEKIEFDRLQVPGCFEIPAAISMAVASGRKYDGYLALGCVIRGETTHYDYVCEESARGINKLAMKYNLPVGYGIITAENRDQANYRADKNGKNVGGRAASACLAMIKIKQNFGL